MTLTGGTAPFVYAWTGPNGFTAASEDISGLKAGIDGITVTDFKGCSVTGSVTLTEPAVLSGPCNFKRQPDWNMFNI